MLLIRVVILLIAPGRFFFSSPSPAVSSLDILVSPSLVVGVRPALEPVGVADLGIGVRLSCLKAPCWANGSGGSVAAGVGISEDWTTCDSRDGPGPSFCGGANISVSCGLDALADVVEEARES